VLLKYAVTKQLAAVWLLREQCKKKKRGNKKKARGNKGVV